MSNGGKGLTHLGFTSYTSNGIFQQTLLVLLGGIIPQNILKTLKNSKIPKRSAIISALNKGNTMIFLDKINQKKAIKIIDNYLKADLELAKSRRNFIISKNIKQYLKDIFKNENLHSIILSEETLAQHFLKHPEITSYFITIIKKKFIIE